VPCAKLAHFSRNYFIKHIKKIKDTMWYTSGWFDYKARIGRRHKENIRSGRGCVLQSGYDMDRVVSKQTKESVNKAVSSTTCAFSYFCHFRFYKLFTIFHQLSFDAETEVILQSVLSVYSWHFIAQSQTHCIYRRRSGNMVFDA